MTRPTDAVYKVALLKYGLDAQLNQTQEELAELIVAINKWRRYGDRISLIEEMVDCEIMIAQLKIMFNDDYEAIFAAKIIRLLERLNGD